MNKHVSPSFSGVRSNEKPLSTNRNSLSACLVSGLYNVALFDNIISIEHSETTFLEGSYRRVPSGASGERHRRRILQTISEYGHSCQLINLSRQHLGDIPW